MVFTAQCQLKNLHLCFLPVASYPRLLSLLLSSPLLMSQSALGSLALPGVFALISYLAYGSQFLFRHIEPHALEQKQAFIFNALVACVWITYARACFTNPGWVPPAWNSNHSASEQSPPSKKTLRWCRKCEALKPPRAHHCKICQRCSRVSSPANDADI